MADNTVSMIVLVFVVSCSVCLLNGKNLVFMIILSCNDILAAEREIPDLLVCNSKGFIVIYFSLFQEKEYATRMQHLSTGLSCVF